MPDKCTQNDIYKIIKKSCCFYLINLFFYISIIPILNNYPQLLIVKWYRQLKMSCALWIYLISPRNLFTSRLVGLLTQAQSQLCNKVNYFLSVNGIIIVFNSTRCVLGLFVSIVLVGTAFDLYKRYKLGEKYAHLVNEDKVTSHEKAGSDQCKVVCHDLEKLYSDEKKSNSAIFYHSKTF